MSKPATEEFRWTDETSAMYVSMYFAKIEAMISLANINKDDATTHGDVKAAQFLVAVCGPQMLEKIMVMPDYDKMKYAVMKAALVKEFTHKNLVLIEYKWMVANPKQEEKLTDYINRITPLGKAAGVLIGDEAKDRQKLLMQVLFYHKHFSNGEAIKNKCIEKEMTLTKLIEWQESIEMGEAMEKATGQFKDSINRVQASTSRYRRR